jgi:hypothetical protein
MALNPKFSTGFRNALLNGTDLTSIFDGGTIDVYSGTKPADADTTEGAGTLLAQFSLPSGAEMVTNGGFAADTDWTKGTGWTIAAGVASSDGSQSANSDLSQAITALQGVEYEVVYTVSGYSAGNVRAVVGSTAGTNRAANGTYTETIVAGVSGEIAIRADLDFVGNIDNVSVKRHAFKAAAASGALALNIDTAGVLTDSSANNTGTAAWFRMRESGDGGGASSTAKRIDGSVGTATADMIIDSTSISSGDVVTVDSFTLTITA